MSRAKKKCKDCGLPPSSFCPDSLNGTPCKGGWKKYPAHCTYGGQSLGSGPTASPAYKPKKPKPARKWNEQRVAFRNPSITTMSTDTERVSDDELSRFLNIIPPSDWLHSVFLELQQRRETDRRIAWEAQRELWIQNAYDNNPLKQAISELLP